jgi:hypothetical protein
LSEKALALVVFKAALSPEVKWKTPEGLQLDEFVTDWDKHFRGRFDAFSSQRIALKNAEINQVRAVIAGETEPLTINLDVLSFTAGKSGSALTSLGKSSLANILSVGIPATVVGNVGPVSSPLGRRRREWDLRTSHRQLDFRGTSRARSGKNPSPLCSSSPKTSC